MKAIERPGDLAPSGIKSTYCEERMDFNSTFRHMFKKKRIRKANTKA